MSASVCLKRNAWESDFFGREVVRIEARSETSADLRQAMARFPPDVLFEASVEAGRFEALRAFTEAGFFVVDVQIDFERRIGGPNNGQRPGLPPVRMAALSDLAALQNFAASTPFPSRFYRPPFSKEDGRRFYARWLENAVLGRFDDVCLVAVDGGAACGFVTVRRVDAENCRIGLLSVSPDWRGRGLARALWVRAEAWCAEARRARLWVATQAENIAAMRFYEGVGCRAANARWHLYRAAM